MKTISISDAKATLSEQLRYVSQGEEIIVTDRGRPVARIVPILSGKKQEELAELERLGLVKRGHGRLPAQFWDKPRPRDPQGLVRRSLEQERQDSW